MRGERGSIQSICHSPSPSETGNQAWGCHRWVLGAGSSANGQLVGLMMLNMLVTSIHRGSDLL